MSPELKRLYAEVTDAIGLAKDRDAEHSPEALKAHRLVSEIEERITKHVPAATPQGAVARRGAVRAAVAAKDLERARRLANMYATQMSPDQALRIRALVPRVLRLDELDRALQGVLERGRAKCVALDPCPALRRAAASLEAVNAAPGAERWLVLTASGRDVPESWFAGEQPPAVFTFDDYAAGLDEADAVKRDVCEPQCIALNEARKELASWFEELVDGGRLVVIAPDL